VSNLGGQLFEKLRMKTVNTTSYLQGRLASLDVFRGITIALMIVVNNQGGDVSYRALQHADWNGWTLADLVFPFFLFIVGAAIPFSLGNRLARGDRRRKLLLRVVRRSIILFVLGLFLNGFPYYDLSTLRIMGVLQRIALCYFFASLIFLLFNVRKQVLITVLILLFYWAIMTLVPVPRYGAGVLGKQGNLASYIDNLLLGREHLWEGSRTWGDPEGLLSTIPAIATTLLGVLAGENLRSNRSSLQKAVDFFFIGNLGIVMGTLWDLWFPINKSLWTSSYVVLTGGISLIFLATYYYVIDIKKHMTWTKPFIILGTNAIIVYVLSEIVSFAVYAKVTLRDGTTIALKTFVYRNYFASWAGSLNGSLLYALAYLVLWIAVAATLYKSRIFIKV